MEINKEWLYFINVAEFVAKIPPFVKKMWFSVNIWSNFQHILSLSHNIFTKTHSHNQKGKEYHKYTSNQQITAVIFMCEKNVPTSSWDPALVILGYRREFTKSSLILGFFISSVQRPYTRLLFYLKNRFLMEINKGR